MNWRVIGAHASCVLGAFLTYGMRPTYLCALIFEMEAAGNPLAAMQRRALDAWLGHRHCELCWREEMGCAGD